MHLKVIRTGKLVQLAKLCNTAAQTTATSSVSQTIRSLFPSRDKGPLLAVKRKVNLG